MSKIQYYNIKYPFNDANEKGFFLDLNETREDKIRSELLHLIFTPKGQRIRMPEYGTDLIKFIFEENDEMNWGDVKAEISEKVSRYVPQAEIKDIEILQNETDEHGLRIKVTYKVKKGNSYTLNEAYVDL